MSGPWTPEERLTSERYFHLVDEGLLSPDDRTELLEGVIVSMAPQNPAHAATVWRITTKLTRLVGDHAMVRCQLPLLAGAISVPEPDITVVPWRDDAWQYSHPDCCLLAIEVAESSLAQDRLTKSRIYAGAGVSDYWIVNLKNRRIEWYSSPDSEGRVYASSGISTGNELLPATQLELRLTAEELFPPQGRA